MAPPGPADERGANVVVTPAAIVEADPVVEVAAAVAEVVVPEPVVVEPAIDVVVEPRGTVVVVAPFDVVALIESLPGYTARTGRNSSSAVVPTRSMARC